MKTRTPIPAFAIATLLFLTIDILRADLASREEAWCQSNVASLAPADSATFRKFAPDREVDIKHLALDVTPDFRHRTVAGRAAFAFQPVSRPLRELRLDAVDLRVTTVTATASVEAWQATGQQLVVTFATPIEPGRETSVTIEWTAEPREGLYFRTTELGYRPGEDQIWTQGEAIEARHWYPCFDSPNAKFTTEVTCRVPEGMIVLSNGRKISEQKDSATGLVAFHWSQEKPHANYLVSLIAGYFKKVEDQHRDVPLAFYTSPSDIGEAPNSFAETRDIMAFFEQEIGVPFPWARYDQVTVRDFTAGGMENTSMTTLTDRTLTTLATENLRSSRSLVAHEMAHQWFGDLVTCKDWSHIWLNEGFATYYDLLYDGQKNGQDDMLYRLYGARKTITENTAPPRPIVFNQFDQPMDLFGYLPYQKGSWVLHMLRAQLGPDLYRRCIKTYLERFQYKNVVTADLNSVVEELSGRSFDQFFDQWVFRPHHPELDVSWSWDQKTRLAKVSVRQTQRITNEVGLFRFPLKLRFKAGPSTVDREVLVQEKDEDFYFPLDRAPEIVRIDPGIELLARINFSPSAALIQAQLADASDAIGRVFAVEALGKRKDIESVNQLKSALNHDAFHAVRLEAARALQAIHTDDAFNALLTSQKQSDARVRLQVATSLGAFYRPETFAASLVGLENEKNPDIAGVYARNLAPWNAPEATKALLGLLDQPSYRDHQMESAITALRATESPAFLEPIRVALDKRGTNLTTQTLNRGLDALAYLARNDEKKDAVRELIVSHVNGPRRSVQLAALNALGLLDDPHAIPILESFAAAAKQSPEREAAERSLAALRANQKPSDNLRALRNEVLELQKQNRDLRTDLDALKKRFEATPVSTNAPAGRARPAAKATR